MEENVKRVLIDITHVNMQYSDDHANMNYI